MKTSSDTIVMIWLVALVAPPILFGIWIRVKLALTEGGSDFLVDREIEKNRGEWETPFRLRERFGEQNGKIARSKFDDAALAGSHGQDVAILLAQAIPFLIAYIAYVMVIGAAGYFWLLS